MSSLPELTSVQLVKAILKGYEVNVDSSGNRIWRLNGKTHREDGPAIEYRDGSGLWFLNGQHHREDGPAVEYASGYREWWLNGERMTEKEFNRRMQAR